MDYGQVLTLYVVDAFTDRPFSGNPAGVAILDQLPPEGVMQNIALEMNLSETAFVTARADGDFDLRWFTPTVEVDFCGHATLATAHIVGRPTRFHTRSGVLTTSVGEGSLIEMDFPADPVQAVPVPPGLNDTGITACWSGRFDLLAELRSGDAVREFQPDMANIMTLKTRGLIITAPGDRPGVDCVSRFFAPNAGVPEDPVTGSAHCTLAGYWGKKLGRNDLVGEQASARGGIVHMGPRGDRVVLAGHAVTVSEVRILV